MAFSIKWAGPPRSYTEGRPRAIRYVVLHTTEGSEGPSSAEDGNAYDKRRTDGVSTHYFTDSAGAALCEVHDEDTAHAALYHGNAIGIQIEICGRAGQSAAQWDDAVSRATLETTAQLVAHLCKTHDIPPVRLSVEQCRASWYGPSDKRPKGIVDHYTVTRAYPEDGGTHTDVGPHFPWSSFLARVNEIMEGDEMDAPQTAKAVWHEDGEPAIDNDGFPWRSDSPKHEPPGSNEWITGQTAITEAATRANKAYETALQAVEIGKANGVMLSEIRAMLTAGVEVSPIVKLAPESVAEVADATVDELHGRVES